MHDVSSTFVKVSFQNISTEHFKASETVEGCRERKLLSMVKAKPGGTVHKSCAVTRTNMRRLPGCCFFPFKSTTHHNINKQQKKVITKNEHVCAKWLSGDSKLAFDTPDIQDMLLHFDYHQGFLF